MSIEIAKDAFQKLSIKTLENIIRKEVTLKYLIFYMVVNAGQPKKNLKR